MTDQQPATAQLLDKPEVERLGMVPKEGLQQDEAAFKALVENAPDLIARFDQRQRYLYVNPAVEAATHLPQESFIGKTNLESGLEPDTAAYLHQSLGLVLRSGQEKIIVFALPAAGKLRYYEARLVPEWGNGQGSSIEGGPKTVLAIARDVTQRMQAEKALRVSEERYTQAAVAGQVGIWAWNLETDECYLAPNLKEMLGYEDHKVRNHIADWKGLIHPDDRAGLASAIEAHLAGLTPRCEVEHRKLHRDGTVRWFLTRATTIREADGQPVYMMGTDCDITERKQVREERERLLLAEREQRLLAETLAEVTLALTAQIKPTDVLDEILRQVQRLVPYRTAHIVLLKGDTLQIACWQGYRTARGKELVANLVQPLADLPLDREIIRSRQAVVIEDTRREPRWVVQDPTAWVRAYIGMPICLHDRVVGLLRLDSDTPGEFSAQDVERLKPLANAAAVALENAQLFEQAQQELGERKQAEKQLRFQAQLLDSVRESVVATDLAGRVLYWGKGAERLYGYRAQEVMGRSISFVIKPGEKEKGEERKRQVLERGWWRGRYRQLRKDGSSFWADSFMALVRDQEGQPYGLISIDHDISQLKEAEEQIKHHNIRLERAVQEKTQEMEAMTERLVRQEKLAAIGKISGSIAHELRNPLGAVRQSIFYLNRLDRKGQLTGANPKVSQHLQLIESELHATERVISDLLEMTRLKPLVQERLNLQTVLLEAVERLNGANQLQLQFDFEPDPFIIWADPFQIRQVFINLLTNAAQAGADHSPILVKARLLSNQNQRQIQLADSGHGIEAALIDKVFEPLYTSRVKGTGLGLTICKQIIENHQGRISLNSQVGQGTTVQILLPGKGANKN